LAEDKIPVLTEVYKPKKGDTLDVTPDLVAKVTAQVKPRLESEITDFVLEELRAELKKAHSDVISSTQDFVDKTKANLKTELPSMYQEGVKLSQIGIMHSQVGRIQQEAFAKLREEFGVEKDRMLSEATAEAKAVFSAQMTEGQEALKQNIERVVNQAIPDMESRVRKQLTADLQQLLLKVKFVLPEN